MAGLFIMYSIEASLGNGKGPPSADPSAGVGWIAWGGGDVERPSSLGSAGRGTDWGRGTGEGELGVLFPWVGLGVADVLPVGWAGIVMVVYRRIKKNLKLKSWNCKRGKKRQTRSNSRKDNTINSL